MPADSDHRLGEPEARAGLAPATEVELDAAQLRTIPKATKIRTRMAKTVNDGASEGDCDAAARFFFGASGFADDAGAAAGAAPELGRAVTFVGGTTGAAASAEATEAAIALASIGTVARSCGGPA
jgi:hypothetical protein